MPRQPSADIGSLSRLKSSKRTAQVLDNSIVLLLIENWFPWQRTRAINLRSDASSAEFCSTQMPNTISHVYRVPPPHEVPHFGRHPILWDDLHPTRIWSADGPIPTAWPVRPQGFCQCHFFPTGRATHRLSQQIQSPIFSQWAMGSSDVSKRHPRYWCRVRGTRSFLDIARLVHLFNKCCPLVPWQ